MAAAVTADRPERLLRWFAIVLTVVAMLAVAGLLLLQDESRFRFELTLTSLGFLGIIILSPTVGALIIQRRPFTRVAWLLVFIGVSLGLGLLTAAYGATGVEPGGPAGSGRPLALAALVVSGLMFVPALGVATTFVLLLFPTDRLLSPRWRPAAAMAIVGGVVWEIGALFRPGDLDPDGVWNIPNPLGAPADLAPVIEALPAISGALILPGFLLGVGSLVVRYRRAGPVEAAQIRWLALVAVIAVPVLVLASFELGPVSALADELGVVFLAFMPIAIGIAISRYRLYDIDRLINRTIVYGSLTAILAGVFTAAVGLAQRLFVAVTGDKSDAAVVATTLIVATLYAPLRKRLDAIVERRFKYEQSRYGAYREELRKTLSLVDASSAAERLVAEIARETGLADVAVVDAAGTPTARRGTWPISEGLKIDIPEGRGELSAVVVSPLAGRRALDDRRRAEIEEIAALAARTVRRSEGR